MGEDRNATPSRENEPGDLRVYFAAQRTMLAWVRTGVALMGFGFVVARFGVFLRELAIARGLGEASHGGGSVWAGTALLLVGVGANAVAAARFGRFARDFKRAAPVRPTGIVPESLVALILAAIGLFLISYLMRMPYAN